MRFDGGLAHEQGGGHLRVRGAGPARPGAQAGLTGGTLGPEASVFALILVSVVTLGALSMARKASQKDAGLRLSFAGSHPVDGAGSS